MNRIQVGLWLGIAVGSSLLACSQPGEPCPCAERSLRLATTTSVDNTGLLAELLPAFERRTCIRVQVLAVGTGQALKLAENGDVDALVVHDVLAEEGFMAAGHGVNRRLVMHNDFVLVGPASDPAGLAGGQDVLAALTRIHQARAPFVSRGDQSGTHKAELRLWQAAGLTPGAASQGWYLESGQGMRLTLTMADEKRAYCLTDRATFQVARDALDLSILAQGDPRLHNPYHFSAVHPGRHPKARYVEAMALGGFLTSAEGQDLIGAFRSGGQPLFHPDALTGN